MRISYYKNKDLSYSSRKRYRDMSTLTPYKTEIQRSVIFGDGANTALKTSSDNICDYVVIDDTRWFVVSYDYLNGKQVRLNLQRDVIGEFGIDDMFGKIDRGYTDSILKYKKELSLNQILKSRTYILPKSTTYGNYYVNSHDNEMWGVLYFTKPTGIDPNTGKEYEDTVNVNIPAFTPQIEEGIPVIANGAKQLLSTNPNNDTIFYTLYFKFVYGSVNPIYYEATTYLKRSDNDRNSYFDKTIATVIYSNSEISELSQKFITVNIDNAYKNGNEVSDLGTIELLNILSSNSSAIPRRIASRLVYNNSGQIYSQDTYIQSTLNYTGLNVKSDNSVYNYTSVTSAENSLISYNGQDSNGYTIYQLFARDLYTTNRATSPNGYYADEVRYTISQKDNSDKPYIVPTIAGTVNNTVRTYSRRELTEAEKGNISITVSGQMIDEPFSICVMPLYNVTITSTSSTKSYNISKEKAFNVFNSIIQFLSGGTNPYLVDAQVYPYPPSLGSVNFETNGIPLFSILSNTYDIECEWQPLSDKDVKKDYIERSYRIVSPDQSGKYDFSPYDYNMSVVEGVIPDKNNVKLSIVIKTALKPFSIISSCIIIPNEQSIIGITYGSDMRGSQPSTNGFEASLSSNAFQTYRRENSNYQEIFGLQQTELKKSHEAEKLSEITSVAINTLSATAMGAIAGGSVGNSFFGQISGAGAIGAAAGGAAAGATVGAAMGLQYKYNEGLRDYEETMQQQMFDLNIGTIKKLPNTINRISSFNEIIARDFRYVIEVYECSEYEKSLVDTFINRYGYEIGVYSNLSSFYKDGWFLKSTVLTSNLSAILQNIANKELRGGIYLYGNTEN